MIKNKDRYPDAEWLPESEVRVIGDMGGVPLVLVGFEVGFEAGQKMPLVARSRTDNPETEELSATPLYELMKAQDPISITESF